MSAPETLDTLAQRLHRAMRDAVQIPCPGASNPAIDLAAAYAVARRVTALRQAEGETPVGRKIGFTNPRIWDEYNVHGPLWGHVYDSTLHPGVDRFDLTGLMEPQIEPEIVLRLGRAPAPDMDETALMGCLSHVAHGFEIVQSLYPGWRFSAPDSVMGAAMHGALLVGPWQTVTAADRADWQRALTDFSIQLLCDGAQIDQGHASAILGQGPLTALLHLVRQLADDPAAPPLAAGEIVTTGTLTRAFPIAPGQTWTSRIKGLATGGLSVSFVQGARPPAPA